jgi:hypothetical protein
MKRLLCVVFALALAGIARSDEPTTEQLAKDSIRLRNELVKVLDGVKDKAAAEKAKPKVHELQAKLEKTREALRAKPEKEVKEAYRTAIAELGESPNEYNAWVRLAKRFQVAADDPVLVEEARGVVAEMGARGVNVACEAYYAHPKSGNVYPDTLHHLLTPPFGGTSFLKNGIGDLVDPWGVPYRYEVGKVRAKVNGREIESDSAYVWTERKIDGKVRVFGTKPPEKKQ